MYPKKILLKKKCIVLKLENCIEFEFASKIGKKTVWLALKKKNMKLFYPKIKFLLELSIFFYIFFM